MVLGLGKTNRSAFQCLQKYQQHNKALKRKEWTREEDRLLTQLVQEMRVGSHIPYRRSECPRGPCRLCPCCGSRAPGPEAPHGRRQLSLPGLRGWRGTSWVT